MEHNRDDGSSGTRQHMTFLLYFMAFGWMLVLFASLIGLIAWILIKVYRALAEPPDPNRQPRRSREDWDLNHLKRAGQ
jgi:membrane protein implicated in regulation of membrane protease activity